MPEIPATMRQLRSLVTPQSELRLSVSTVDTPRPGPRDVLVRVEAAPINPSDLALLLAMADVSQAIAGEQQTSRPSRRRSSSRSCVPSRPGSEAP